MVRDGGGGAEVEAQLAPGIGSMWEHPDLAWSPPHCTQQSSRGINLKLK